MDWPEIPLLWRQQTKLFLSTSWGPQLRGGQALYVFYHAGFEAVFVVTETSIEAFRWNKETGWADKLLDRRLCVVFEHPERLAREHEQHGVVQLGGVAGARILRATAACFLADCNEVVVAHEDLSLRWYSCESGELGLETRSTRLVFDDSPAADTPSSELVTRLMLLRNGALVAGHTSGRVTYLEPGSGKLACTLLQPHQPQRWLDSTGSVAVTALASLGSTSSNSSREDPIDSMPRENSAGALSADPAGIDAHLSVIVGYAAGFLLRLVLILHDNKPPRAECFLLSWAHTQGIVDIVFLRHDRAIFTASRSEIALTDLDAGRLCCRRSVPFRCAFAKALSDSHVLVGGDSAAPLKVSIQPGRPMLAGNGSTRAHDIDETRSFVSSWNWSWGVSRLAHKFSTSMLTACLVNHSNDLVFVSRSGQLASLGGWSTD
jgi:hypothetical protein